jgi:hypothetical protein
VFPTITSDRVYLRAEKTVIAELFNSSGMRVEWKEIKNNGQFDLSNYAPGVYFIRVASENKTFKIIRK